MIPHHAQDLTIDADLMWSGLMSKPDPFLGNVTTNVVVAKTLGGGSVINGMVYDRASAADLDAWEALGNKGWGWAGMKPYFIKGTTYQPASAAVAKEYNITYDPSAYGSGPLTVSVHDSHVPDNKDYWAAWRGMGVRLPLDGNDGEVGPSWFPNTMDKRTGRRAHARYAYLNPIANRTNLKVLTKTTAQKVVFTNTNAPNMANGVEILDAASGKTSTVYAKREVILAAGSILTPKLLQLSGVGPKNILKAAGVKVRVELDAVGSNFQDHPYGVAAFNAPSNSFPSSNELNTNATYNATAWDQYVQNKTGPYTVARGNALAFISLPDMTSDVQSIVNIMNSQNDSDHLPSIYKNNKPLLKGFARQRKILAGLYQRKDAALAEFGVPSDGSFSLLGVEKPLSRGTININAKNPQGPPDIFFNAFSNPTDKAVLGASLRYYRTYMARPELNKFNVSEIAPGTQYKTDNEIFSALVSQSLLAPTLAHPSGSCPMMAREEGGCVSDKLLVYGTQHLSVIDASIIPLVPSCHLQATMYGVAEKAADIIKARN
ncbi:GMC oxidoreductase [Dothidotthia symphoricarpi CBS 119687]|uniref:GMC oxidoreductase n=1 Tax=Dothidotthia symphoricarpi CBS 119687 TaxID=1392245 RepID=A0A6A5ZZQ0_9PLEO|nr:GMC oxidoreductase [Dothidotthia symphoricarpi CBS 119687]KAF2124495.1 GMC oxidoreductase [Dothidotthia symphoricarpi CBS 119687]